MRDFVMKALRSSYRKVFKPEFKGWTWPTAGEREKTNKILHDLLMSDKPCFVGRMGTVEGAVVLNYLTVHSSKNILQKMGDYITDNTRLPWWDCGKPFYQLQNNAGFFSDNFSIKEVERFCELYLSYIPTMDVCGRFSYYEKFLPFQETCEMVQLETLYPFFVDKPWMEALRGKKVLVVHPFKETIISQYQKRKELFPNENWLPEFDLKVIKSVQSAAGEKPPFKDWFEALDSMKTEIDVTDYEIAIVGCGAYGLPLAGYIKSRNKKVLHIGGGTQLLFGIKGKRWEKQYRDACYRNLFNEHWVYPDNKETPQNAAKIEGACYW